MFSCIVAICCLVTCSEFIACQAVEPQVVKVASYEEFGTLYTAGFEAVAPSGYKFVPGTLNFTIALQMTPNATRIADDSGLNVGRTHYLGSTTFVAQPQAYSIVFWGVLQKNGGGFQTKFKVTVPFDAPSTP